MCFDNFVTSQLEKKNCSFEISGMSAATDVEDYEYMTKLTSFFNISRKSV
jgi:hypothetical protein